MFFGQLFVIKLIQDIPVVFKCCDCILTRFRAGVSKRYGRGINAVIGRICDRIMQIQRISAHLASEDLFRKTFELFIFGLEKAGRGGQKKPDGEKKKNGPQNCLNR